MNKMYNVEISILTDWFYSIYTSKRPASRKGGEV